MERPNQALHFEGRTLASVADLVAAAVESVQAGTVRVVHRDDWEPTLLWLDRLAGARCDWQPWVTEAWGQLLQHPSPTVAGCAVDALAFGEMAFVSLDHLLTLSAAQGVSGIEVKAPSTTQPETLAGVLERLNTRRAHFTPEVVWLTLARPSFEWAKLETAQDVLTLARQSAALGHGRVGGFAGVHHSLDWLRKVAALSPPRRGWVPEVLASLLSGETAEVAAANDYLVCSPEAWMCAPGLEVALAERPGLAGEALVLSSVARARCAAPDFAALRAWLAQRAQAERDTSPAATDLVAFAATHGAS